RSSRKSELRRRVLSILDQLPDTPLEVKDVLPLLDSPDPALASAAAAVASRHRDWISAVTASFSSRLKESNISGDSLQLLEAAVKPWLAEPSVRDLASCLAESSDAERQQTAWRLLATADGIAPDPRWVHALEAALGHPAPANLTLVLNAAANLQAPEL